MKKEIDEYVAYAQQYSPYPHPACAIASERRLSKGGTIFQRFSILLITLLKFDLFVSMMRDNTVSGSGYRVCMVMTERLVDIFRFQV